MCVYIYIHTLKKKETKTQTCSSNQADVLIKKKERNMLAHWSGVFFHGPN